MGKWAITAEDHAQALREHVRCRAGDMCLHVLDTERHCALDGEAWPCLTRRLLREGDIIGDDLLAKVADIEILTSDVETLRAEITSKRRDVEQLRATISAMSEDLDTLNETNHRASKRVGRLKRKVALVKHERLIALNAMRAAVEDARVLGEAVREYVAWMRDDTATRTATEVEARLDALLAATRYRLEDRW